MGRPSGRLAHCAGRPAATVADVWFCRCPDLFGHELAAVDAGPGCALDLRDPRIDSRTRGRHSGRAAACRSRKYHARHAGIARRVMAGARRGARILPWRLRPGALWHGIGRPVRNQSDGGMQTGSFRHSVVIALLLVGGAAFAVMNEPRHDSPRWPTSDTLFAVDRWTATPEHVEQVNGATFVTRQLSGPNGTDATLTIVTNQSVKLFEAGAEVPFQGDGYDLQSVPTELLPLQAGVHGLLARRADVQWLVYYAYGERRKQPVN